MQPNRSKRDHKNQQEVRAEVGGPIDLVYTWVNSGDTSWNVERQRYAASEGLANRAYSSGSVRFANHGELALSIRTALCFVPFVRNIYVVHAGDAPEWQSTHDLGNVLFVRQDELVPADIGPTFQSDVVECFIYRLPELSEQYIYSNDDFFFSKLHRVANFFLPDGRCNVAVSERFAAMGGVGGAFQASEVNSIRALQKRIKIRPNVPVGTRRINALLNHPAYRIRAMLHGIPLLNTVTHVAQPYLRTEWQRFHQVFASEISNLCQNRFRSNKGYAINLMYHQYLRAIGRCHFYYEPNHAYLDRRQPLADRESLRALILTEDGPISRFCLNDNEVDGEDGWSSFIESMVDSLLSLGIAKPRCRGNLLAEPAA